MTLTWLDWSKYIKKRLAEINAPGDFQTIFFESYPGFNGSPRACADTLKSMTPPDKQTIAEKAIVTIRQRFSTTA